MKILNLFAGIGGNRLLWDDVLPGVKVTSVEFDPEIAKAYSKRFSNDDLIVGDAWDYAAKNYLDFDFIWASPPCQTHSRLNIANNIRNDRTKNLPDFRLYELIVYMKFFCKKPFVVENVVPYYEPLVKPTVKIGRHLFWSNFYISEKYFEKSTKLIKDIVISDFTDFDLSLFKGIKNKRQVIRNQVDSNLGKYILGCAFDKGLFDYAKC